MNIGRDLRIVFRILKETFKSLKRAGWMNWVVISTMAAILSIFGCMFRISIGIDTFVKEFGSVLEISVYLKNETNPQTFIDEVKQLPNIKDIQFISKDDAWNALQKEYSVPDIDNPLPDTLHIRVNKVEEIDQTVEELKNFDGIESVNYSKSIVQQMKKIGRATSIATIILMILLGGLTLFIISNTIHLLIQSCSREIEIMSMMGVSSWYIKTPYLLQGAFYGLAGAIVALLPLYFLQNYIAKIYDYINIVPPALNNNIVVLTMLGIGVIVGASGSMISIQKFLKI